MKMRVFERIAGVVALIAVIAAWIIGGFGSQKDLSASLKRALPMASRFEPAGDGIYAGHADLLGGLDLVVGYVTITRTSGYGGPMQVAVGLNRFGKLAGVSVVEHKETPPFYNRIKIDDYIDKLVGKPHSDNFTPGDDIDAVSGATVTLTALTTAVRRGGDRLASEALGLEVSRSEIGNSHIGFPELVLILLFAASFLTYSRPLGDRPKARKIFSWVTRLAGLALIGFVLTIPLSIININSLLIGYAPDWGVSNYWYLMIVGALLPLILVNKDVYCQCICPFGAAQDLLKAGAGERKFVPPKRAVIALRWVQRALALTAIVTGLLYRNPARLDYEVFGTFFTLTGTVVQLALLGVVLIASLFLVRPWCGFLCPLRAVSDYARMLRLWGLETARRLAAESKA